MFKTRKSVQINRSPQDVFDYVNDPANDANWQGPIESSRWTSEGPPGVGSTKESVIKFLGRKSESTSEVTIWDPPNTTGFKLIGGPMQFQGTFGFESTGEGGTELTEDFEFEFGGFFKLAEGLVGKRLEKQLETDFDALKLLLESEQG
ncbi:MAG: SRPBCC family protein [Acidobacteria bacterium]|nr:SRPBCC family protein [Acidobacteriota bacterium]